MRVLATTGWQRPGLSGVSPTRVARLVNWWRVSLPYAVFGIRIEDGVVVEAPPIARWMKGKDHQWIEGWVKRRGGRMEVLGG